MSFAVLQLLHDNEICNNPAALAISPALILRCLALLGENKSITLFEANFHSSELFFPFPESITWRMYMRRIPAMSVNLRLVPQMAGVGVRLTWDNMARPPACLCVFLFICVCFCGCMHALSEDRLSNLRHSLCVTSVRCLCSLSLSTNRSVSFGYKWACVCCFQRFPPATSCKWPELRAIYAAENPPPLSFSLKISVCGCPSFSAREHRPWTIFAICSPGIGG